MRIRALTLAAALAAASFAAVPGLASDKADIMALVKQYNDTPSFKAAAVLCTDKAIVIDDFAPHVWQGATACADWGDALDAYNQKNGITGGAVTLGSPWHVVITGDRGYAVYPTHYSYKQNGKPVTEKGVWTFALQKVAAGWRIAGWSWAQH